MTSKQVSEERARLDVRNIGGIEETEVTFSPGVTVLAGRNATNRTSLLQGLMAALGSDDVSIKGGTEEAAAELTLGEETYTRQLQRTETGVVASGDPYLADPTVADLFAFLLESNESRQAIAQGRDLRELIMRPVDTEEIQSEVDRLIAERKQLESELEELESLKSNLPSLEERRASLQDDIKDKRAELEAKEAELEDADIEERRAEKEELEETLSELRRKRSELEDVRYDIDTERETIESLRAERNDLEEELAALPETPVGDTDELDSRIERLRGEKQSLETDISEFQSIIGFNEEMLNETDGRLLDALGNESGDNITEELLPDDSTVCWTCGSEVQATEIEQTVERLRDLSQDTFQEISDIEDKLDELTNRRQELERTQRERERVERRLSELDDELESSRGSLERLQEQREALTDEVADIEETVEELEGRSHSEVLDLHKEANQLEYDLGRLEGDLDEVEADIERIEERLGEQDDIEAELESIDERIGTLQTRIDRIEDQAIEGFNEQMDTVLDLLDYENLDRIWLERKKREVREGRRKVEKTEFDLHVVRTTAANRTYEDTVDHLSESEREVTGLVFALAGYLAHEVHEKIPFMILDSLEPIDRNRLSALIDYLDQYADHLVVALLTEDAAALDREYEEITDI